MVTNTATVSHDAYTVELTQIIHTIIKQNNKQKRQLRLHHTVKSKLYQPRRKITILQ